MKCSIDGWKKCIDVMHELKLSEKQLVSYSKKYNLGIYLPVPQNLEIVQTNWASIIKKEFKMMDGCYKQQPQAVSSNRERLSAMLRKEVLLSSHKKNDESPLKIKGRDIFYSYFKNYNEEIYDAILSKLEKNLSCNDLGPLGCRRVENVSHVRLDEDSINFCLPELTNRMKAWAWKFRFQPHNRMPPPIVKLYFTKKLSRAKGKQYNYKRDHIYEVYNQGKIVTPVFREIIIFKDDFFNSQESKTKQNLLFDENLFVLQSKNSNYAAILAPFGEEQLEIKMEDLYMLVDNLQELKHHKIKENHAENHQFQGDEIYLSVILQLLVKIANSNGHIITSKKHPEADEIKNYLMSNLMNSSDLGQKRRDTALHLIRKGDGKPFDSENISIAFSPKLRIICEVAKKYWEPVMNEVRELPSFQGKNNNYICKHFTDKSYKELKGKNIKIPLNKQIEKELDVKFKEEEMDISENLAKNAASLMRIIPHKKRKGK